MEEALVSVLQWNADKTEEIGANGQSGDNISTDTLEAAYLFVQTAVNQINILEEKRKK